MFMAIPFPSNAGLNARKTVSSSNTYYSTLVVFVNGYGCITSRWKSDQHPVY